MAQHWTSNTGLATNAGIHLRGSGFHLIDVARRVERRYFGNEVNNIDRDASNLLLYRMRIFSRGKRYSVALLKKFIDRELPRAVSNMNWTIHSQQYASRHSELQGHQRAFDASQRSYVFLLQRIKEDMSFNAAKSLCYGVVIQFNSRLLRGML